MYSRLLCSIFTAVSIMILLRSHSSALSRNSICLSRIAKQHLQLNVDSRWSRSTFKAHLQLSMATFRSRDDERIQVTEEEKELFAVLLAVATKCNTVVRIAGGWVRDRYLKLPNKKDIDVALDNCTGRVFCEALQHWCVANRKQHLKFGVIKENPDKSKHLETARAVLDGFDMDFVNLRGEHYCATSRIPTMTFGTIQEDAYRRDLTINSLYYNLNTGMLEDITGLGLQDIEEKLIRTPLPAFQTLRDDPLRTLRCVRFATRFGFKLTDELFDACRHGNMYTLVSNKVSQERIIAEFEQILAHGLYVEAVHLLWKCNLYQCVVRIEPGYVPHIDASNDIVPVGVSDFPALYHSYGICLLSIARDVVASSADQNNSSKQVPISSLGRALKSELSKYSRLHALLQSIVIHDEFRLSALTAFGYPFKNTKKKGINADFLMKSKFANKDVAAANVYQYAMHSVCNLQGALLQVPKDGTPRQLTVLEVGRAIRNPAGPFWKHGMLLALSDAILRSIIEQLGLGSKPASSQFASDLQYFYGQHEQLEQVADMLIAGSSSPLISSNSLAAVVRSTCAELSQKQLSFQRELSAMETILESIEVFGLEDCCSMKPMVAGEKLKEIFPLVTGRSFGKMMNDQMEWLMAHRQGTEEELIEYLTGIHGGQ